MAEGSWRPMNVACERGWTSGPLVADPSEENSQYRPAGLEAAYGRSAGRFPGAFLIMSVVMPNTTQNDWVKTVLFDRGYLARIRGEAIKVYLAIIEACGGAPDRSVTISLSLLMKRTQLSCPTVIDSLAQLEELGLVVSTTHQPGKVKTYYVSDPPAVQSA